MSLPKTNMIEQIPYRKKLRVGDIFRLAYPEEQYIHGRIMSLSASAGGFDDCIKIYVYDHISKNETLPDDLDSLELICEPLFINRLGFSRGFMPVVSNIPLTERSNRNDWCFYDIPFKKYLTESGEELSAPTKHVGTWGLSNYLILDELISEKLGLEIVDDVT